MTRLTRRGRCVLVLVLVVGAVLVGWWLAPLTAPVVAPINQGADVLVCGNALDGMEGVACFHPADVPPGASDTWTIPAP